MLEQKISNYIGVPSVDEYLAKEKKLGGRQECEMTIQSSSYVP